MSFLSLSLVVLSSSTVVYGLNNGLGATPAMGYSTWNDCSSFRDNGPNGWCWNTEDHVKNVTLYMIQSGLAALGYNHINVDEGWLLGRYTNGTIYEDLSKFPSGMMGLGDWVHAQETSPGSGKYMKYGLYSCRGTCQCGTGTYSAPGSHGYEAMDTDWMIAAGADYLKIDSCCGDQTHSVAFSDYAKFRDAMNATGKEVWFSLCGWEEWYAPPDPSNNYTGGTSLGNSWRIAGDGDSWGALTNCMNVIAAVSQYSGAGGWSDPDLLIGPEVYVGGQSDENARAQFTMWSLFPSNLLISQNVLAWSPYALETYSNAEAIAINQDPLASPAFRIIGADLTVPCSGGSDLGALAEVVAANCNPSDPSQQWTWDAATGHISSMAFPGGVLDDLACGDTGTSVYIFPPDNGQGTCGGKNQIWSWTNTSGGTILNSNQGLCLDIYDWTGPTVDVWDCNGGTNQGFQLSKPTPLGGSLISNLNGGGTAKYPRCLSAQPAANTSCTNVWGRVLSDGYAIGMVNNGPSAVNVTCDTACFAALNITATSLKVRDVWAHQDIATLTPPFSFSAPVNSSGFAALFKLSPA